MRKSFCFDRVRIEAKDSVIFCLFFASFFAGGSKKPTHDNGCQLRVRVPKAVWLKTFAWLVCECIGGWGSRLFVFSVVLHSIVPATGVKCVSDCE